MRLELLQIAVWDGWSGALGNKPGHNIGNFLVGHGMPRNIPPPVGRAEVRTTGDNEGAQSLIADQAEIRPIGHRTRFRSTFRSGPWHEAQNVVYTASPCCGLPGALAA